MQIPKPTRKRLIKIYEKVDPGADLCIPDCHDCCNDPGISYLEFVYLVSDFSTEELKEIFSRPRELIKEKRPDLHGHIKERYYCPLLEDGKCLAYEKRPWICRSYHRDSSGICMLRLPSNLVTSTISAGIDLIREYNSFAPPEFRDVVKPISKWYQTLIS